MKNYIYFISLGLLFFLGVASLFPNVLTPILELGFGMITLGRILGLISVILAIYLSLSKEQNKTQ